MNIKCTNFYIYRHDMNGMSVKNMQQETNGQVNTLTNINETIWMINTNDDSYKGWNQFWLDHNNIYTYDYL